MVNIGRGGRGERRREGRESERRKGGSKEERGREDIGAEMLYHQRFQGRTDQPIHITGKSFTFPVEEFLAREIT